MQAAASMMYVRSAVRWRVLEARAPKVRNTMAESVAWPLGKLRPGTTIAA